MLVRRLIFVYETFWDLSQAALSGVMLLGIIAIPFCQNIRAQRELERHEIVCLLFGEDAKDA